MFGDLLPVKPVEEIKDLDELPFYLRECVQDIVDKRV